MGRPAKVITWDVNENGCWICTSHAPNNKKGYARNKINGRRMLLHRLMYEQKHGPIPEGLCLCHRCDNSFCINPEHLFLGTKADNTADMVKKGRNYRPPSGEGNPNSKLTIEQAREIKNMEGVSLRKIAKIFNISHRLVLNIKKGTAWKHV